MPSRRVAEEGERDAALYGRSHHRRWGERDGGRGGPQGRPVDAGPAPRQLSALLGQRGRGQGLLPRRGPISRRRHRRSPRGARPGRRRLVRGQGGVMKPVRLRLFALAATTSAVMGPLVVIAGPATSAHAATHHVLVVPRDFSTIQAAVDAASPGDTVNVSPGTFTEQVVINKDLDLHGAGAAATVIKAPPTLVSYGMRTSDSAPLAAIVRVGNHAKVQLFGLGVAGPVPCTSVDEGI